MRQVFVIIVVLILILGCCSAQRIEPQAQPNWDTKGTHWSQWKPIAKHPDLLLRGACGDDTQVKGVPMFTLYTQIRNGYPYAIAVVWDHDYYDASVATNRIGASTLQYLDPATVTQSISAMRGTCKHTDIFYVKVKCVARRGQEDAACSKDALGNYIADHLDHFQAPSL
jgi:hypothetical protein